LAQVWGLWGARLVSTTHSTVCADILEHTYALLEHAMFE